MHALNHYSHAAIRDSLEFIGAHVNGLKYGWELRIFFIIMNTQKARLKEGTSTEFQKKILMKGESCRDKIRIGE